MADRQSRPQLPGALAIADVLEGRIRTASRVLDAVDLAIRHDVLYRQQAAEVEGRHLRRRTAHRRDPWNGASRASPGQREARGTPSRVAARSAADAHT